jgi:hypothetical protein
MKPKPETYDEFCERYISSAPQMGKYEFGAIAFAAGERSGMAQARVMINEYRTKENDDDNQSS